MLSKKKTIENIKEGMLAVMKYHKKEIYEYDLRNELRIMIDADIIYSDEIDGEG